MSIRTMLEEREKKFLSPYAQLSSASRGRAVPEEECSIRPAFQHEDLTEAIALGHDLGHTPFGHAGEETLNEICPGGFHHAAQSLRVVDLLEKDGRGLNLTFEVRDGIQKHSKGKGEI